MATRSSTKSSTPTGSRTMRATTVRFGSDLWAMLDLEAQRSGVSVAQYVREAALTRIAYSAGRRGEDPFGSLPEPGSEDTAQELTAQRIEELEEAAEAVRRQATQAQRHSRALMEQSRASADRRAKPKRSAPRSKA